MQVKNKALKRLNTLYVIFFSVVIIAVLAGITSRDFLTGFKEGFEMGSKQHCATIEEQVFAEIPIARNAGRFNIPFITTQDSTLTVNARITSMDFFANGSKISSNTWTLLLIALSSLSYGSIFIIIFIILYSLKRSIKNNNIFNRDNIKFTRAIGILLIASSLIYDAARYLECRELIRLLADTNIEISTDVFHFKDIITGLLILVIAEIFAIGYDITEEQKLTI